VDLSDLAEDEGVESLHSIVLDFDAEGRLVGIEIPGNAEKVLPRDLLTARGYDETRYRRSIYAARLESAPARTPVTRPGPHTRPKPG
jgi:uncharacterized protein YuzE